MASGALPAAGPSGRPPAADVVNPTVSGVVHRQLDRTKLFVKLIDLGVLVAWAGAGLLGYFLVLAIVDHWVVSLGTVGRWLSLVGMLVGLGWLFAKGLAPLLLKRINPAYAAHTIEETMPAFKNSISTFLDLEQEKRDVHAGILEAVGHKAARDIGAVEVDSVVDRSQLIRVGYVLVAIFASFAAYKILSPRDPLQTVARVLAPWADISRPSRVRILELSPGNKEVYYGDSVEVKISVRGTHDGDEVRLIYSTADGQTVDRAIVMKAGVGNVDYTATLPANESAGSASQAGIQQDLIYRVEAGDAVSNSYRLSVISAPTILVKRLSYAYPAYMKKAALTVDSQGDISAPEGTKVRIEATANVPIATAVLEMDPVDGKPTATLDMSVEGQNARGGLQLLRDRDGNPKYRHYQVRITTSDGQKNAKPILHAIEVLADLPPEATILSPEELVHEVPLDGVLPVEVRAVDPDFGLTSVRLATLQGEQEQVLVSLLKDGSSEVPQFTGKGELSPAKLKMKVGDELTFFAMASDNRHDMESGSLRPNVGRSVGHVLRVIAPESATKAQEKPADDESEGANKPKEDGGDDMSPMEGTSPENMPPKTTDKPKDNGTDGNNTDSGSSEEKTNENQGENKGPENPGENSETEKGSSAKENSGKNDKNSKGNSSKKENGSKEKSEGSNSDDSGNKEEGSSKQQDNKNKTGSKESKTGAGEGSKEKEPSSPMNKPTQGNSGSKEKSGEKNSDKSKKNGGKENSSGGSTSSGSKEKGEQGKEKQGGSSKQQEGATQDKSGGGEDAEGSPMGNSPQSGESQSGEEGAGPTTGEAAGNSETPSGRKGADSQDATGAASGTDSSGGSGGSGADKPAGDHDGEKFDRILERIKQKQGGTGSDSGTRNENSRIERSKNQSTENRNLNEFEGDVPGSPRGKEAKGNPNPSAAKEVDGNAPSGANPTNPMEGAASEGPKEKGTSGRNKEGNMNPGEKEKLPGTSGEKEKGIGGTEPQSPEKKTGPMGSEGTGNDASQKEKEKRGGNAPEAQSPERNPGRAAKNKEGGDGGAKKPSTAGSGTQGDPMNGALEQGLNKDTPKDPTENRNEKNTGELSGPSKSKKQSNAKSSTSGSESGQGSQGGGQQANQAGKGSAGSNQSDDDGAGASKEKGNGEDGVNGGDGNTAEGATGRPDPNKQKGNGSTSRSTDNPMGTPMNGEGGKEGEGSSGAGPMPPEGGKQGKAPRGKQGTGANPMTPGGEDDGSDNVASDETATAEGSPAKTPNTKGMPSGIGAPGKTGQGGAPMEGSAEAAESASGEVPDGDAANLDYTRKATAMALDYLKDQEHNPDPELLKELNWTEADLKNFLKRWEALSDESKTDATKKHELDEALRSLGLSAPTAKKRQGGKASDAVRGIGDGQSRVAPPSRYRDQFEAFRSRQGK